MRLERRGRWLALGTAVLGFACGGKEGGGTAPCTPGAATQLVKTSGDPAPWYINNPLPAALSVTARDANNCAVPGVAVNWAVASGGGAVTGQGPTNENGVATATDSIGSTSPQKVTATFTGLANPDTFTVTANAPSTTMPVDVKDNFFSPQDVVIKEGGTVTWTWVGAASHTVTYDGGPLPLPPNGPNQTSGTFSSTPPKPGRYTYKCLNHANMSGTVTVVH